jgi:hypothetical protein
MAVLSFSALCAYGTSQLDSAAELICLHPFVGEAAASFHIYAEPEARFDFALTGEIDAATSDVFATTPHRLLPLTANATVQVNAEALQFIGHRQMALLDELAEEHDRTVVLRTNQHVPRSSSRYSTPLGFTWSPSSHLSAIHLRPPVR